MGKVEDKQDGKAVVDETIAKLKAEELPATDPVLATYYAQSARLRIDGVYPEERFNDGTIKKSTGSCQFENHFFKATNKKQIDCVEKSGSFRTKFVVKVDDTFMAKYIKEEAEKKKKVSPRQRADIDMSYLQAEG